MKLHWLAPFILISGCTFSTTIPYKEGSSISQYKDTLFQCKLEANNAVPVRIGQKVTPIVEVPETEVCTKTTSENGLEEVVVCEKTGGYTKGGDVIEYDINQNLRDEYLNKCVQKNGYENITLPVCEREQRPNRAFSEREIMKSVTQQSCVVRNSGGTGWVVN